METYFGGEGEAVQSFVESTGMDKCIDFGIYFKTLSNELAV